ncbi:MAG: VWA domain-containing protein [Elusimicrobiota bacterium]
MRFADPLALLLIPFALAGALWALHRERLRRAPLAYPGSAALARFGAAGGVWRRLPVLLKALALVLMVAALARPQRVFRQEASWTSGVDILLVLDTSLSMRALDFGSQDRMGAAKDAARAFIRRRTSDRIGILVFAGVPLLTCPLTLDYDALLEFLSDVQSGMTESDGTAIGDGIAAAVSHVKDAPAKNKVLILVTDGANNTGVVDPLTAARAAKACGIRIYAIGTGRKGPAMVPVDDPRLGRQLVQIDDELDEGVLESAAAETGGRYYRAQNLMELNNIYGQIDRLEKTERRLPPVVSYHDLHAWLLVPAALLLLAGMALGRTLLMRIP